MTSIATEAGPAAARRHAVFHPLRVASVEQLTDDSVAISFEVPDELRPEYDFTHGQHLTLRTEIDGVEVRRNYSICAPARSGRLRVAVKKLDGGAFSAYAIGSLRPGDVIDVMTPTGRFYTHLDAAQSKRYVAIAAGSGITPVLSILATALEVEPSSSFTLVYGNRTTRSVMFLDELADLKDRYPARLQVIHVLSREPREVELLSGRIDAHKLGELTSTLIPLGDVDEWFLCGPFEMVEELRDALLGAGVGREHVHMELFHVEGEAPRQAGASTAAPAGDGDTSTVTVMLDGRASTFEMSRDGDRILDAALGVRGDAPYACKGGVCGTCRAKLVEGEVDMVRNYALEQSEIDGGFVLACQSHPVSDTVVLDFDQ